jgi:hypothetical protein
LISRKSRLGIVDFSEDKEDEKISYCKECLKFGFSVPLKNRIYPNNEPIPPDHESWKMCYECGSLVPVHELQRESEIKDVTEPTNNPFDQGKEFLGIDSRKARNKREKQNQFDDIKDEDLKRELKSGQTQLISYSEYMPQ